MTGILPVIFFYVFPFINSIRLYKSQIAIQNLSKSVNVVCEGSPSLILIVRRISFGITTRPKSSILLTIPVAFIYLNLLLLINHFAIFVAILVFVVKGILCIKTLYF